MSGGYSVSQRSTFADPKIYAHQKHGAGCGSPGRSGFKEKNAFDEIIRNSQPLRAFFARARWLLSASAFLHDSHGGSLNRLCLR